MLYTLFSPSEGKHVGGSSTPLKQLLFGLSAREEILKNYNTIANSGDTETLKTLFGIKKESEIEQYVENLFLAYTMASIERYNGVAYEYLDFKSLSLMEQNYLKTHTIIFSNLYGPIMGGDFITNYKVKQGNSIGGIAPDNFYKETFTSQLDTLLEEHEILDLRAGYYDKFYKITQPYTTLKFIKDGKVVSHWAKAYRGIVLRHLAQHNIPSLDAFMKMEIPALMVREIKKINLKTEIIYDIVQSS